VGYCFGATQKDQNHNHHWQLALTSEASHLGEGLVLLWEVASDYFLKMVLFTL
jgi:hypothetical protein